MENNATNSFYQILNELEGLKKVKSIIEMYGEIPKYRTDMLVKRIGQNIEPFTKTHRYRPTIALYENYVDGKHKFKVDVIFFEDGNSRVVFWDGNPKNWFDETRIVVANKLELIDMLDEFVENEYGKNGYEKNFTLDEFGTMDKIDDATYNFITNLFNLLKLKN